MVMIDTRRFIDVDDTVDSLGCSDEDIYCKGILREAPIVDAVEVVRCEDCIHSKLLKDTNLIKENPWRYYRSDCRICGCHDLIGDEFIIVDDDFFCKYGKRKETKGARD